MVFDSEEQKERILARCRDDPELVKAIERGSIHLRWPVGERVYDLVHSTRRKEPNCR